MASAERAGVACNAPSSRIGAAVAAAYDSRLLAVIAVASAFWILYVALDLNRLHALREGIDSGIFLQSLSNFAHTGTAFNWAEGHSHFLVHDSCTLLVLAPIVALFPAQETLIVAQVSLLAASSVVLYLFSRTIGVSPVPAALLSVAFLICPSMQGFAYYDFSESHFEPVLIFALAIAAARKNLLWTAIVAQMLLGVKEDVGFFLIWFGIAGAIWYDRRLGLTVALLAVANVAGYYAFERLHDASPSSPHYAFAVRYPGQDLAFFIEILVPFAFAPLQLGWRCLVALPLIAELCCATSAFPFARAGGHYTEALVSLMGIATAIVLVKKPRVALWCLGLSLLMALLFNTTVLHPGRHLFAADPHYASLSAARSTTAHMFFRIEEQGAWDVVAADPNARIERFGTTPRYNVPAWNVRRN